MDGMTEGLALAGAQSEELPPWHGKRGRPSKSAVAAWEAYLAGTGPDPRTEAPGPGPGAAIPLLGGVGVPPKPKAKPRKNLEAIERSIVLAHAVLAAKLTAPELMMGDDEAHMLAESFAALAEHYKIRLDGKQGAWAGVVYSVSIIYGPRAFAYFMRQKTEAAPPVGHNGGPPLDIAEA